MISTYTPRVILLVLILLSYFTGSELPNYIIYALVGCYAVLTLLPIVILPGEVRGSTTFGMYVVDILTAFILFSLLDMLSMSLIYFTIIFIHFIDRYSLLRDENVDSNRYDDYTE